MLTRTLIAFPLMILICVFAFVSHVYPLAVLGMLIGFMILIGFPFGPASHED